MESRRQADTYRPVDTERRTLRMGLQGTNQVPMEKDSKHPDGLAS